eukprot:CAMPEP_0194080646 /NCGR_PEP_ID=MMETSP0149-20130528/6612_1 /TAXON_ID=122233 /ORGANISM="Chaetoceros debilis, Strain MM31A-1" /LENGTH=179 /DNA_ID=CAMNT_0038762409 /DNA_START=349 /DNA_END=886 /DNA_ORIENTATION=+
MSKPMSKSCSLEWECASESECVLSESAEFEFEQSKLQQQQQQQQALEKQKKRQKTSTQPQSQSQAQSQIAPKSESNPNSNADADSNDWTKVIDNCTTLFQSATSKQNRKQFKDAVPFRQSLTQKHHKRLNSADSGKKGRPKGRDMRGGGVPPHTAAKYKKLLKDFSQHPLMNKLELPPD